MWYLIINEIFFFFLGFECNVCVVKVFEFFVCVLGVLWRCDCYFEKFYFWVGFVIWVEFVKMLIVKGNKLFIEGKLRWFSVLIRGRVVWRFEDVVCDVCGFKFW